MADHLSNLIQRAKLNEIAQNEAALAGQINAQLPQSPELDEDTKLLLIPFLKWCDGLNVHHLPATPTTCAAFILSQHKVGFAPERIAAEARAIELLHDHYGLANPLQTRAARWALEQVLKIEPPRSWPKEEKVMFMHLPVQIRNVIANREQNRETHLRRSQNEIAAIKKQLMAAAATKPADTTEKGIENDAQEKERLE
jgi:hypothetical protein